MKKYFFIILSIPILFSCGELAQNKESRSETQNPKPEINISGYWANVGFMGKAKTKGLGNVDFYATEMTFDTDSVLVDNGFESYKLKYDVKDSVCTLYNAFQGKNLQLKVENSDFMQFIDSSMDKIHGGDFFNRGLPNGLRFEAMLNENLLVGKYFLYEKDKKTNREVEFTRNGEVKGLEDFMHYSICYSGDCTSSPLEPANIITLKNRNAEDDDYVWKKNYESGFLKIYKLEAAKADIKGARKIEKEILDLRP
jgi:hypothetical protein